MLAERTGLEPATPGVTGRYSNQLNYRSVVLPSWWVLQGSNLRPSVCKTDALPAELNTLMRGSAVSYRSSSFSQRIRRDLLDFASFLGDSEHRPRMLA